MLTGSTKRQSGTVFYGGIGLYGAYITDFLDALVEVGIVDVSAADQERVSTGSIVIDSLLVLRDRKSRSIRKADFPVDANAKDGPLNLIGYSYGSLLAAHAARAASSSDILVDNLVMIASPVSRDLMNTIENDPNIKQVHYLSLLKQGDFIEPGMSLAKLLVILPCLLFQRFGMTPRDGHFFYEGNTVVGKKRRRDLATQLFQLGLR